MAKYREQKNILFFSLLCALLGFMLTIAVNTYNEAQRAMASEQETDTQELIAYIKKMETETARLEEEISVTRSTLDELQLQQEQDADVYSGLTDSLALLNRYAALTELTGPGLVITLDDNLVGAELAQKNSPETYAAENYIIHDKDILYTVRALAPHAEAVAINGIRLVDTTSIRCTGTVIMINSARLAPPYEITVIGDVEALTAALHRSSRYYRLKYNNMPVSEAAAESVTVPAYNGVYTTTYSSLAGQ